MITENIVIELNNNIDLFIADLTQLKRKIELKGRLEKKWYSEGNTER